MRISSLNPRKGYSDDQIVSLMVQPKLLERSFPLFWPHGVYSIGYGLRLFTNWPLGFPIPCYTDHGSNQGLHLDQHEHSNSAIHYLTWCKDRYAHNIDNTQKKFLYIKSPHICVKESLPISSWRKDSCGSLIFYPHSCGDATFDSDHSDWFYSLLRDVNPEPPIAICFHPFDLSAGMHMSFRDSGFKIVTAGNSQHPDFIRRFYYMLSSFNYTYSRTVGSELFFSFDLGLDHSLYGTVPDFVVKDSNLFIPDFNDSHWHDKNNYIRSLFLFPKQSTEIDNSKRRQIAIDHLGLDSSTTSRKLFWVFLTDFFLILPSIIIRLFFGSFSFLFRCLK